MIQLILFTKNSVMTNNTVVPIYKEFSFDKRHIWSCLQWIQLLQASHGFITIITHWNQLKNFSVSNTVGPFKTSSVMTSDTVVPIYNEFSYDKQYSCSYLQWIQLQQTIQLFLFTINSVMTSDTVVPIYNEISYDKWYSCSYLQWI